MKTILLVDDSKTNLDILIGLLEEHYDLLVATSGEKALKISLKQKIDLILLDIVMPDMNGYEVCQRLKTNDITKDIPVIFATAKTDDNSIAKAYETGGVDYISKPFKYYEIIARINTQLSMQQLIMDLEHSKQELNIVNNDLEGEVRTRIGEIFSLNKEIEETQKEIVFTIGAIGESRCKETGNHVKRVAEYSKLIALKYGLSHDDAELLKQASPMHDIGKIAIEDAILKKPARLTTDEFEIMKNHSFLGYEMLKNSQRPLLKLSATIALEHHEKWDGTGYPNGLKGEDISIYGRITAIADVFDALGSSRVYKPAWEDEKIFALLKDGSGVHFDPTLVTIFFKYLDEILEVRDSLND